MKSSFQFRIRVFSVLIVVFALLLISKLYILQIVHGDELLARADRQYMRPAQFVFNRGSIYFTDKDGHELSAASLKTGFIIAVNPQKASSSIDSCLRIKSILEIDCEDYARRIAKPNDTYEEILKRVEEDKAKAVEDMKLPGISLYKDVWRLYPAGNTAAHVLGFVGYKGDILAGRYGLESFYDDVLKRAADNVYINFFAEIFGDIKKTVINKEELEGDIVTTIDPTVQTTLEKTLDGIKTKWNSESVGGIIINPKTGEIYSMALTPGFDPNNFRIEKTSAVFSNDVVENVHEMGSIIKPLTMAVAIDLGLASSKTTYDDSGSVTLNGKTIYNFDKVGRGVITMQEAMGKSLNTGFVFLSQKIGHEQFQKYFKAFGLGEKTGIDLPNEARGLIDNLNSPRDIEYATASFGQGIAMTPVEVVRALSAVANGGTLITPHIVKKINYSLGYSKTINFPEGARVIKKTTSEDTTRILVEDFDSYFQNGKAKNPHYSIAEKTGTAQIPLPNGTGYYEDRNLHSFFGYLPAYDPQFLVFMYTVHPQGAQYSSESLGPAFVDLTKFLINYYNIPPDR